jgi:hypothetical protein
MEVGLLWSFACCHVGQKAACMCYMGHLLSTAVVLPSKGFLACLAELPAGRPDVFVWWVWLPPTILRVCLEWCKSGDLLCTATN